MQSRFTTTILASALINIVVFGYHCFWRQSEFDDVGPQLTLRLQVVQMGGWGSKQKAPPQPQAPALTPYEQGQLELKRQRDRCDKYQKRADFEIDACLKKAKAAKDAGNKDAALNFLKLKKLKEKQRTDVQTQLYNLEMLLLKLEEQKANIDTFKAMEAGSKVLKGMQEALPIERAEAIMEQTQEALDYVHEIEEIFTREIGVTSGAADLLESEFETLGVAQGTAVAKGEQILHGFRVDRHHHHHQTPVHVRLLTSFRRIHHFAFALLTLLQLPWCKLLPQASNSTCLKLQQASQLSLRRRQRRHLPHQALPPQGEPGRPARRKPDGSPSRHNYNWMQL